MVSVDPAAVIGGLGLQSSSLPPVFCIRNASRQNALPFLKAAMAESESLSQREELARLFARRCTSRQTSWTSPLPRKDDYRIAIRKGEQRLSLPSVARSASVPRVKDGTGTGL
jgi:hypothetical protein